MVRTLYPPTLTQTLTEYSTKGYIWGRPIQPLLDSLPTSPIAPTAKGFDLIILSDLVFNHSQVRSIIPHSLVQQAYIHETLAWCPAHYMRKYINIPSPIRIWATSRTHNTSILHPPPPASRSSWPRVLHESTRKKVALRRDCARQISGASLSLKNSFCDLRPFGSSAGMRFRCLDIGITHYCVFPAHVPRWPGGGRS
jgi:hypothetical protein